MDEETRAKLQRNWVQFRNGMTVMLVLYLLLVVAAILFVLVAGK